LLGRKSQALSELRAELENPHKGLEVIALELFEKGIEGVEGEGRDDLTAILGSPFRDPEGRYHTMRCAIRTGHLDIAVDMFRDMAERGFVCHYLLDVDPWLEPLRGDARIEGAIAVSRRLHENAIAAYERFGGERVLGVRAR